MHRVVWSDEATDHLAGIKDHIAQFDPAAAAKIADRLARLAASLSFFPERGRPAAEGSREMVTVRPFIMRYIVEPEQIIVLGIRHAARLPFD